MLRRKILARGGRDAPATPAESTSIPACRRSSTPSAVTAFRVCAFLSCVRARDCRRRLHTRQPSSHAVARAHSRMTFPDIAPQLKSALPDLRGRLLANEPLAPLTWFRVGGPAQGLFMPEDEADLAYLLAHLPHEIPVLVIGLGSNLIVRDGGVPGVVIRLGRGFSAVKVEDNHRIRAGTGVPDVKVARAAQETGIAGLAFFRGIPGAIGGALRMNGGAYGRETKDALVEARGVDRRGRVCVLRNAEMRYSY